MNMRPPRSKRTPLAQCFKFGVGDLRAAGAIQRGETRRGILNFAKPDGSTLTLEFRADLRNQSDLFITLRHRGPAPGDDPPAEPYRIALAEVGLSPRHGSRLSLVCPILGRRAQYLYLPPKSVKFASSAAHDLLVESDRFCGSRGGGSGDRVLYRLQRAQARLAAATTPKPPGRGKRGAGVATIAKLRDQVAAAEQQLWHAHMTARAKVTNE